ncbi:amidohydrolase [Chitinophaga sp. 30R24]|uniref:amidohydrolase n=1 Tax=Chitinophaga sp. 30R24 TaxID=3248838 RepID=UPI003B9059F3
MAQTEHSIDSIDIAIKKDQAKFETIFRDIHQHPELGFQEFRTAHKIATELRNYGYDVKEKIGTTGIAGIMRNGSSPIVMYRADMDCNAVKETTGLPYASIDSATLENGNKTPVMHACGHDAHTAWMLAVAKFFSEHRSWWHGTIIFIGQPAEEPIQGAEAMVNGGLYTDYKIPYPTYLFGMHTAPIKVGMATAAAGVRMAGTDQLDVTFHGIGGHGPTPNLCKVPIVMAAAAIMQYQSIVSRAINPKDAAVITVGSVQAGMDNNVIPSTALLKINLRWFKKEDRNTMKKGIERINEGIAYAYNLPKDKYPTTKDKGWAQPLDNDSALTKSVNTALKEVVDSAH